MLIKTTHNQILWRNGMKKLIYLCLFGVLGLMLQPLRAQDKAQEKTRSEERAKELIPVKLQIVFAEFDGEKKVSSMLYTFMMLTDEKSSGHGASLRTGIRIPIEVDGKDQKTTYIDVGSNMDCNVMGQDDGRFLVRLIFDRSALFPNKSSEGERLVFQPNGQPIVRAFRTNESLLLRDGQTLESMVSTDPLNGHTIRVILTLNVLK